MTQTRYVINIQLALICRIDQQSNRHMHVNHLSMLNKDDIVDDNVFGGGTSQVEGYPDQSYWSIPLVVQTPIYSFKGLV